MTALDTLVAALRERHPPTPELEKRLAPCKGRAAPMTLDQYYLRRAAAIAGSWLDELTDDELELRAAYDRTAHEEFEEYEDEDTGEMRRRRVVAAEQLRWTEAEVARRPTKPKLAGMSFDERRALRRGRR
ncbi:MAG: hypothetical protein ACM358_17045 [Gemmatimonadota bacterium]